MVNGKSKTPMQHINRPRTIGGLLPAWSENLPMIGLERINAAPWSKPGMVEAEAINPISSGGVPSLVAKGFRTGFLDIVEERMAKKPMTHNSKKKRYSG